MTADFDLTNHGSIVLLKPMSQEAHDWALNHLPEDAQMFGNAYVIEPRYVDDIVAGFTEEGLTYA